MGIFAFVAYAFGVILKTKQTKKTVQETITRGFPIFTVFVMFQPLIHF